MVQVEKEAAENEVLFRASVVRFYVKESESFVGVGPHHSYLLLEFD
jgi:hypothetical protein